MLGALFIPSQMSQELWRAWELSLLAWFQVSVPQIHRADGRHETPGTETKELIIFTVQQEAWAASGHASSSCSPNPEDDTEEPKEKPGMQSVCLIAEVLCAKEMPIFDIMGYEQNLSVHQRWNYHYHPRLFVLQIYLKIQFGRKIVSASVHMLYRTMKNPWGISFPKKIILYLVQHFHNNEE